MTKYIIKNCPAIEAYYICGKYCKRTYCKDVTDCLLKSIADLCKDEKSKGFCITRYGIKEPISEGYGFACRILQLLKIEECENEN